MIKMMNGPGLIPRQFADMSMHMLSPKREIVVDMVMVQLLSAILIFMGILVFKNTEISQMEMSIYMVGLFTAFILLTTIYQRITRFA
jgi:protein-S-isoprenylcysteine O-methyltransferase Ste14